MSKKLGRPYKYKDGDPVEQIPLYLPGTIIDRLPIANGKRNEWLVDAITDKLEKEEKYDK